MNFWSSPSLQRSARRGLASPRPSSPSAANRPAPMPCPGRASRGAALEHMLDLVAHPGGGDPAHPPATTAVGQRGAARVAEVPASRGRRWCRGRAGRLPGAPRGRHGRRSLSPGGAGGEPRDRGVERRQEARTSRRRALVAQGLRSAARARRRARRGRRARARVPRRRSRSRSSAAARRRCRPRCARSCARRRRSRRSRAAHRWQARAAGGGCG